jgi:hypothetical protein
VGLAAGADRATLAHRLKEVEHGHARMLRATVPLSETAAEQDSESAKERR